MTIPARIVLAQELAERNERCGELKVEEHRSGHSICLRPQGHSGEHDFEPIHITIPIEDDAS